MDGQRRGVVVGVPAFIGMGDHHGEAALHVAGTAAARDRASELGLYERAAELQAEIAGLRWITQPQAVASFHDAAGWRVREELLPRLGTARTAVKVEW